MRTNAEREAYSRDLRRFIRILLVTMYLLPITIFLLADSLYAKLFALVLALDVFRLSWDAWRYKRTRSDVAPIASEPVDGS
jgi:hypothetical protein